MVAANRLMPISLWNLYARCYDAIAGLAPYQDMLDQVVAALELAPGMRVLDAGCGTGALADKVARACPEVELLGVDLSPGMLARARARRAWPAAFAFTLADIEATLAGERRGFDRVVSVNLIWCLRDPLHTFASMAKALRPGGLMVHATPRLRFAAHRIAWCHIRRQRGWARISALARLPLLGLAALLNLVLVGVSMGRPAARHLRTRWDGRGLEGLLRRSGLDVIAQTSCYTGQAHMLVCSKREASAP